MKSVSAELRGLIVGSDGISAENCNFAVPKNFCSGSGAAR